MLQRLVNQTHKFLIKSQKTVSVAESCTGGLLSSLLTRTSGSSRYFPLGLVAYSNQAKSNLLKVPPGIIKKKGAVSREVARLMAEGVRKITNSDIGIGITGIAGPSGATLRKPIGTVFIAFASKDKKILKKFHFTGNRNSIRLKAASAALKILKSY